MATSTVTLLGQSQASESATNGSAKMAKSQLDLPIDECDGLRIRENAKKWADGQQEVILDENNNVTKAPAAEEEETAAEGEKKYLMWGFFPVNQPVKTLNSILIPITHLVCMYALWNITLETMWKTIMFGESPQKPRSSSYPHWTEAGERTFGLSLTHRALAGGLTALPRSKKRLKESVKY